jgi:hypothetical protein
MACDKHVTEEDLLLAYLYRGHVIRVEIEQNLDTLYWEAKGVIESIEGGTSHTFSVSGATILLRPKRKLNTPSFNKQRDGSMIT